MNVERDLLNELRQSLVRAAVFTRLVPVDNDSPDGMVIAPMVGEAGIHVEAMGRTGSWWVITLDDNQYEMESETVDDELATMVWAAALGGARVRRGRREWWVLGGQFAPPEPFKRRRPISIIGQKAPWSGDLGSSLPRRLLPFRTEWVVLPI